MLRGRQSMKSKKSKPDLSHRKSTSSVRTVVLEHLDPAVAQRDAHTAAHKAFSRAQDRSSAEVPLFPPPSPLRQIVPRDDPSRIGHHQEMEERPGMPRRQSVRFVGPCTVQKKGLSSNGQRGQNQSNTLRGALDPAQVLEFSDAEELTRSSTPTVPHPTARPGTAISTNSSKVAGGYLQALVAGDDVYTPEDDIASAPSSFRRLRRSRSMFPSKAGDVARRSQESYAAPGLVPGDARDVQTSMSMRTPNTIESKENIRPRAQVLRAPKSMSFLRNRHARDASITSHNSGSTARTAEIPPVPLRTKVSFFGSSKGRRGESSLRKTLRSSSSNSDMASGADAQLPLPKEGRLRNKARKASRTLKDRFRNLFTSNKDDKDTGLPEQHIKSQKHHNGLGIGSFDSRPHDNLPAGNIRNMSRFGYSDAYDWNMLSKNPSQQTMRDGISDEDLNEGKASDDKSRVTSWADSGPGTLTSEQQLAWREWEKQRLSIIKENGAHAPSPSLRRKAIGKHILQSQESLIGQPLPPGPTVDSQRVYAALMQRLSETTQLAQIVEQQRKTLAENEDVSLPLSSNTEFDDYEDNGAKPAPLIVRRAISTETLAVPGSQRNKYGNAFSHPRDEETQRFDKQKSSAIPRVASSSQGSTAADGNMLSPPVHLVPLSQGQGPDAFGRISSERSSAFFGSPESHLFRTISPYRRALRESMEEVEEEMKPRDHADNHTVSDSGTEIRRPQEAAYDDCDYSESVYSCDEQTTGRETDKMQSIDEELAGTKSGNGDFCVSVNPPVTYRPTGHRVMSSVNSIDWKTWLSANVAKLEPSASPTKRSEVEYALPSIPAWNSRGHVRESAQIESEEGTSTREFPLTRRPTLPNSPPVTGERDATKTSPLNRSVLRITPPSGNIQVLADIDNSASSSCQHWSQVSPPFPPPPTLPPPGPPPPIPARSPLRMNPYPPLSTAKSIQDLHRSTTPTPQGPRPLAQYKSISHLRQTNGNAAAPRTPLPKSVRLRKRGGILVTPSTVATTSSPGLTAAVEKQFGGTVKSSGENKENEGVDPFGGKLSVGRKRNVMVEVFLSGRWKNGRVGSCEEGGAFV